MVPVTNTKYPLPTDAPVLRRPGDIVDLKTMAKRWWSTPAVGFNSILEIPVFKMEILTMVDEAKPAEDKLRDEIGTVIVPNDIFGVPIRKDLIHRVYWWHRKAMAGYREEMQLYKWEWPGSNKKARPLLNRGLPKMGKRKAPGRWDGSVSRPVRPSDFREKMQRRLVWSATKSMLSAKFAQGQITLVDSFNLSSHKTKHLVTHLRSLMGPKCNSLLCVHSGTSDVNDNFRWASAHIPQVRRENVTGVNVYLLLKYRHVLMTEEALATLVKNIHEYPSKCGWLPQHATPDAKPAPAPEPQPGWDAEWRERRQRLQRCEFRAREFWLEQKNWKWSDTLRGAIKIPKDDKLEGFRLKNFGAQVEKPWERFELHELYAEDTEPLE